MPSWLSQQLRDRLAQQRVPFELRDNQERGDSLASAPPHLVLKRDDLTGDGFLPIPGTSAENPRSFLVHQIGMELLIFARGPVSAATTLDHEDQGDHLVQQALKALYQTLRRRRWQPTRGGFLSKAEAGELDYHGWPGRIYRLRFSVNKALETTDYQGAALDEYEVGPGGVTFGLDTEVEGGQGGATLPSATTE
jgi:hypothetical protein